MIPAEGRLVYLGEGHPPALIGVGNMCLTDLSDTREDGKV